MEHCHGKGYSMRRGFCRVLTELLAGAGLACGLASPAFAQAPAPASAVVIQPNGQGQEPDATRPNNAVNLAPDPSAPPLQEPAVPTTPDSGERSQPGRWYASAEALRWWFKGSPVPVPLLTTTSDPTAMPLAAFAEPGTTVVLGNHDIGSSGHWGGRFTIGGWIDDRRQIAVEGSYFFLGNHTTVHAVSSNGQPGSPILAVPFIDADAMTESSFVLAQPGSFAGGAALSLTSRLRGADALCVVAACEGSRWHVQVLAGFRYLDLTENLTYATASTGLSGPNTDLALNTVDQFKLRNQFFGFQFGARADYRIGRLTLCATASLALGDMAQTGEFNGLAVTNSFDGPTGGSFTGVPTQVLSGSGTFVQPSNLGSVNRDQIAVAPEIGVKVCYQLTQRLRLFGGYDFLYLSNVLRPGDQIDRNINVAQTVQGAIAGTAAAAGTRPAVSLVGSDFWAQGVNLGLEFRY
jgi:hypothetical protein